MTSKELNKLGHFLFKSVSIDIPIYRYRCESCWAYVSASTEQPPPKDWVCMQDTHTLDSDPKQCLSTNWVVVDESIHDTYTGEYLEMWDAFDKKA